jgi:uncharacterized protein YkwD
MNLIDLLFLLVIITGVIVGYRRGFIIGALHLLSWVLTLVASFCLYPYAAHVIDHYVLRPGVWSLPLAFVLTLVMTGLIVAFFINRLIYAVPADIHESPVNKALGIIPGLCNALIWMALLATLLLVLPVADRLSESARHSQLATTLTDHISWAENELTQFWRVRPLMTSPTAERESEELIHLPFQVAEPEIDRSLEKEMLDLVNQERRRAGLFPLREDTMLTRIARQHSRDMFVHGYFCHVAPGGHSPFDRMEAAGIRYVAAGENIALAPTLTIAHQGLMHSPGHRANILNKGYDRVGIGILDGGRYGLMVTQDFTRE